MVGDTPCNWIAMCSTTSGRKVACLVFKHIFSNGCEEWLSISYLGVRRVCTICEKKKTAGRMGKLKDEYDFLITMMEIGLQCDLVVEC